MQEVNQSTDNWLLSVVTLNGRALVPIGEYSINPTFHSGGTHRGPLHSLC